MFNAIAMNTIDTVQSGKKQIVNTMVRHEGLADTINKFVDAETAYTKSLVDNTTNVMNNFYTLFTSKDFTKEVISTFTPSFTKTEGKKSK